MRVPPRRFFTPAERQLAVDLDDVAAREQLARREILERAAVRSQGVNMQAGPVAHDVKASDLGLPRQLDDDGEPLEPPSSIRYCTRSRACTREMLTMSAKPTRPSSTSMASIF